MQLPPIPKCLQIRGYRMSHDLTRISPCLELTAAETEEVWEYLCKLGEACRATEGVQVGSMLLPFGTVINTCGDCDRTWADVTWRCICDRRTRLHKKLRKKQCTRCGNEFKYSSATASRRHCDECRPQQGVTPIRVVRDPFTRSVAAVFKDDQDGLSWGNRVRAYEERFLCEDTINEANAEEEAVRPDP